MEKTSINKKEGSEQRRVVVDLTNSPETKRNGKEIENHETILRLAQHAIAINMCECAITNVQSLFSLAEFELDNPGQDFAPFGHIVHVSPIPMEFRNKPSSSATSSNDVGEQPKYHTMHPDEQRNIMMQNYCPIYSLRSDRMLMSLRVEESNKFTLTVQDEKAPIHKIDYYFFRDDLSYNQFKKNLQKEKQTQLDKDRPCKRQHPLPEPMYCKKFQAQSRAFIDVVSSAGRKRYHGKDPVKIDVKQYLAKAPHKKMLDFDDINTEIGDSYEIDVLCHSQMLRNTTTN